MIYLDNAATSPIDEEVLEAMLPYLKEEYGNPSSKYYFKAENAKKAVECAREQVANLIGAKEEEIIFTSGATESTNFIIKGYLDYVRYYGNGRSQVVTSNAEHKATLNTCRYLNGEIYSNNDPTFSLFPENKRVDRGYGAVFVGVETNGTVSIDKVKNVLTDQVAIASFMYVNNEIGAINNVEKLAMVCHENGTMLHVDCTQALGKIHFDVNSINCDFISASAHKIYGPKGVGFAYIKADKYGTQPITALLHGGEQEDGLRAGTLAVHNIVGLGKAAEIASRDMKKNNELISELDNYLTSRLIQSDDLKLIIPDENRIKGIISILVERTNFNNERFIKRISDEIAVSTGSACSAGEPSHVIDAIGQRKNVSKIIRVSLNKYTTKKDIDKFIEILIQ
jgi:cysteine desulfurase